MIQLSNRLRFILPATLCLSGLLPAAAAAQEIKVASQAPGIRISAMSELPTNPTPVSAQDFCLPSEGGPATDAGAKVEAAGWGVRDEETEGEFTYVAFVGKTTQGTSGSCLVENGNVGIFRGDQLVALVFGAEGNPAAIGAIERLESGGIRIIDGDYLPVPAGDLRYAEGGLFLVRPIADRDIFCDGGLEVPSLFGLPIDTARILLLAEGWDPKPADAETRSTWTSWVAERANNGLEELQDCSGTGFGYCSYEYVHEGDQRLSVTTAGEGGEGQPGEGVGPSVVGYYGNCE